MSRTARRSDAVEAAATVDGVTHAVEAAVIVGWRRPALVELADRPHGHCGSGTAVRKGRANVAEELGDEDGGVALRVTDQHDYTRLSKKIFRRGR
jgi:hypothetical protein